MIVEVRGVNFRNKGAELMLHAVLQEARAPAGETLRFALHERGGTPAQRASLGLETVRWKHASRLPLAAAVHNRLPSWMPVGWRRARSLVAPEEIDVVLDGSGFAYGDPWGARKSEVPADYYERLKRQGARIVLLPQQLGPFEDREVRRHFARILELADLVYARDPISLENARSISPGAPIRQAPDFTPAVAGRVPRYFEGIENGACLVPNQQMVAKGSPDAAAAYRGFLATAARELLALGLNLHLLIHDDSPGDVELAEGVRTDLGVDVPIVREPDPLAVKGILSRCHVTVGSRFHGLVSALSYGVPSLGTGWSHKYRMLFEDFGCADCLVDPAWPAERIGERIRAIAGGEERERIISSLRAGRERYLEESARMWSEVNGVIAGAAGAGVPESVGGNGR